ncbi:uncharacterized protein N7483_007685 [Penicillium malachiteum]|uniref:uncharacterized protein n=1 Tax=Penicillium malachiteum TaxID=1324776 RepID=UPI002548810B|nr:uncharacterized protein N7483_007685 [Penicillium malachiteum]KAJ5726328.1 hypothetical protein N7483_007685 [Penicillium malachiteum]
MDPSSDSPKPYSCVVCHKRKVKCDRREPCSKCAKAEVECIYRPPPPPRRRKRARDASGSASSERDKSFPRISRESPRADDTGTTGDAAHFGSRASLTESKSGIPGRMIMRGGNSVYLENNLWTNASHELADATEVLDASNNPDSSSQEDDDGEDMLLLGSGARNNLTNLHPNPVRIFKLWQTFLENVNPIIKILHTPTLQPQILEAAGEISSIGKELEALMFAVYCIALASLPTAEVERSFGESKKKLLARCRRGAQFAFSNASFLRTSNFMVLQALMLYILSMRVFSDSHTIWTMSGVALRIAQRIGVHRDGSGYGLSVFETEIRRRIWFQLIIIDSTSAQFCGVAPSPLPATADTMPPININDTDLDPRMTEPPCEKEGPTDMIFCLARCEFGKWLRRWSKHASPSHSPWAFLSSSSMSLKEKDKAIDELEELLEQKFLRYCDKSIPLHLATLVMARSVIHYTRLMAHHPRQYQGSNIRLSQTERDVIFDNCLKMAEYADYTQTNNDIQRFSWHTVHHMPWDAMIFMLSEMRFRDDPEEKSKVWQIIGNIYTHYLRHRRIAVQLPLHRAIENLMIRAWKTHTEECNRLQRAPISCPTIVATLIGNSIESSQSHSNSQRALDPLPCHGFSPQDATSVDLGRNRGGFDYLVHEEASMNWNDWDNLLNQFQESLMDDMNFMTGSTS